jgi:hypothetical protein
MESLAHWRKGYINTNLCGNQSERNAPETTSKERYMLYITFQADLFDLLVFMVYFNNAIKKNITVWLGDPPTGRFVCVLVTWGAMLLGAHKEPSTISRTGADL